MKSITMLPSVISVLFFLLYAVNAVPLAPRARARAGIDTKSFSKTKDYPLPNLGNIVAHDPNVVQHDGYFYLYKGGVHIPIHRARSLSGPWEQVGTVLDESSVIQKQNRSRPWAPTTIQHDNRFYCFYAISENGSRDSAIGVASSDTPTGGNWTDHGAVVNTGKGDLSDIYPYSVSNAIDGAFITDQETGQSHLLYGSYWHGIFSVPLADDLLSVKTPKTPNATNLAYIPDAKSKPIEGSFMTYKEPYYYLWFSHGKCCHFDIHAFPPMGDEYSIRVGRSKSATGPFVDKDGHDTLKGGGTIVYGSNHGVVYAPGGVGVLINNGSDADVLYYHYLNTTSGFAQGDAHLGWNYLHYVNGWPVAVEGKSSINATSTESSGRAIQPNHSLNSLALLCMCCLILILLSTHYTGNKLIVLFVALVIGAFLWLYS